MMQQGLKWALALWRAAEFVRSILESFRGRAAAGLAAKAPAFAAGCWPCISARIVSVP